MIVVQLVAGSGTTQERDEAETAPADGSTSSASASASAGEAKDDGYSEGVPGPITRLFVIANRGIANLVQDLILVSNFLIFPEISLSNRIGGISLKSTLPICRFNNFLVILFNVFKLDQLG